MTSKPLHGKTIEGWETGHGDPEENWELVVAFSKWPYALELNADGTLTLTIGRERSVTLPARLVDHLVQEHQEYLAWQDCWECNGAGKVIDASRFTPGDDGMCEVCEGAGEVRSRENQ